MRRLLAVITLIAPLVGSAACDAKATEEECRNACSNVTELYLGAVQKQASTDAVLQSMGTTGAKMAEDMAKLQLDFLRKECMKECNAKATRKQTECLISAKSSEDISRCN